MILVHYIGKSPARVFTSADLAAVGLVGLPDIRFDRANRFTVEVDGLTAAFLAAQGEFRLDDGATNFVDALLSAFPQLDASELAETLRVNQELALSEYMANHPSLGVLEQPEPVTVIVDKPGKGKPAKEGAE